MRNENRKSRYWWTFSDARGIDRAYKKDEAAAEKDLEKSLAGPMHEMNVAPDDTKLKNPDGEFKNPAAMVEVPADRVRPGWDSRGDRFKDPQGQQGGMVPDPTINPRLPDTPMPPADEL